MQNQEQIEKLAKATFWRAVRESIAGVFVLIASAYSLEHAPVGSAKYYGLLLSIVSIGFILGVVWSFTISRRVVERHPVADTVFWREAFEAQAKLLRFVPLWYAAPLTTGAVLSVAPTSPDEISFFLLRLAVFGIICAGVIYLNKTAADRLEAEANQL